MLPGQDQGTLESFENFLQYAYAYYAACVVSLMRYQDVENELASGDAMTILRTFWKERSYVASRAAHAPTHELGYDAEKRVLWFSRDELTRLYLRDTPPAQHTEEMVMQADLLNTTFYWDKQFYKYTTRFPGSPIFQYWAPLPNSNNGASHNVSNPLEAIKPGQRELLEYVRRSWPKDFTRRPEDPLPYDGVLLHGFDNEVFAIGISKDAMARKFLEIASTQNEQIGSAKQGLFRPRTRYLLLKGEQIEYTGDRDGTWEGFVMREEPSGKQTILEKHDPLLRAKKRIPLLLEELND